MSWEVGTVWLACLLSATHLMAHKFCPPSCQGPRESPASEIQRCLIDSISGLWSILSSSLKHHRTALRSNAGDDQTMSCPFQMKVLQWFPPFHFQEQVKIPEWDTQSPHPLPPACPSSFVFHHLPQVNPALSLHHSPQSSLECDRTLRPRSLARAFHSIWDALHSPLWLVSSFVHSKSWHIPQWAPCHACHPMAGHWDSQLHFHSTLSLHASNPPFTSGFYPFA